MIKKLNIKGIFILFVLLVSIQYGTGLLLSPLVTEIIQDGINKYSQAKVIIDKASIWPFTLTLKVKGAKVSDPDDISRRVVSVENAEFRLGLLAALSKRFELSGISADNVEVTLVGEPDGSFNIQKLGGAKPAPGAVPFQNILAEKGDAFDKVYGFLKERFSKKNVEKRKAEKQKKQAVKINVQKLPKGQRVEFKAPRDMYFIRANEVSLKNVRINFIGQDKEKISVENARIKINDFAYDADNGVKIKGFSIKGALNKDGVKAGELELRTENAFVNSEDRSEFVLKAKDIDLKSLEFIYADSLPVMVQKGKADIVTRINIVDGNLSSVNRFIIKEHAIIAKDPNSVVLSFVPMSILCEALNQSQPLDLSFQITGTVENPEIKNFEETLSKLVKPYISNISKNVTQQGLQLLNKYIKTGDGTEQNSGGGSVNAADVEKTIDAIKGLFKK